MPRVINLLEDADPLIGAPTLIFVTGAALRVADVTRVLKDKKLRGEKGGEVAKLFAKHFKLEEHVTYLKRTKVGAAVGTPGRIGKLLCETGQPFSPHLLSQTSDHSIRRTVFCCSFAYHARCDLPRCKETELA